MRLLPLAARSLFNRRVTATLTVLAIAVSVALLLGVQKLRTEARESFASTISGTDLIVGARSGPVNLLLYSVFRIGDPTSNISWQSYQLVARHPDVAWTIPISLGDSHRGYRVVGTTGAYFEHYRYGERRPLAFSAGGPFSNLHDAVVGAEVARALGYSVGERITIAHGIGEGSFAEHDDQPFKVVGVLAPTGTPVDRSVHVSLEAITAIHEGWESGMRAPAIGAPPGEALAAADLTPKAITAFLVGLDSRAAVFQMQRALNEYRGEALSAVIPGVALQQLWQVVGIADTALLLVAACVVVAGLLGMVTALLTSLNERRREMAILRSVGARPRHVFLLLEFEAALLAAAGVAAGFLLAFGGLALAAPALERRFGLFVHIGPPGGYDLAIAAAVVAAGLLAGLLPAWRAYRNSLADGLSLRT